MGIPPRRARAPPAPPLASRAAKCWRRVFHQLRQPNNSAEQQEQLRGAFAGKRMEDIGERLAVGFGPFALVRHPALEEKQRDDQDHIRHVEIQNWMAVRKSMHHDRHAQD